MLKCRSEHRPQTSVSGFQGTAIDSRFQFLRRFLSGEGGDVRGLEPAVFLDLVIAHGFQGRLGAHDNHCLELAVDLSGFAPNKIFADIKFRHVAAFPWKYIVVFNDALRWPGVFAWIGSMAAVAGRRLR